MQVSVEKTSELSRKMTVSVSEEVVQEKMAARLKSLAREVKVDGFRPGKVPQHVVKKMFGDRVRGEITGDLIQSTYYEALQNHDLKPAGYPHIHPADDSEGFKYTAEFEVYPEISLAGIDQLEVVRPVATVEEADVDDMIQKLREQKKNWLPVDRGAAQHDKVTISFSGTVEGENFTDGVADDFEVEIGTKQMIPGFEDQLLGLRADAKKSFSLSFPEDYNNEKLAGKLADFEIEVKKIEQPELPEVDEAFIKAYGIEEGTELSFREGVKRNMERELEQALRNNLKTAVMDALYEKINLTLPRALIDQEIDSLMEPYNEAAQRQKLKPEDLQLPREIFEKQAKRRVALGLILAEVIKQNGLKLDKHKVLSAIEEVAKSYEHPEEVVKWYFSNEKQLTGVQQMVLEDQTVEWLLTQAKVTESVVLFSEIMDKR